MGAGERREIDVVLWCARTRRSLFLLNLGREHVWRIRLVITCKDTLHDRGLVSSSVVELELRVGSIQCYRVGEYDGARAVYGCGRREMSKVMLLGCCRRRPPQLLRGACLIGFMMLLELRVGLSRCYDIVDAMLSRVGVEGRCASCAGAGATSRQQSWYCLVIITFLSSHQLSFTIRYRKILLIGGGLETCFKGRCFKIY